MPSSHFGTRNVGDKGVLISSLNVLQSARMLKYYYSMANGGALAQLVNVLASGMIGLGLSSGWRHCVVFLGKTLYSYNASLQPGV